MSEWYYSFAPGTQEGPVDAEDLALLHADGQLKPDSLVWREGMAEWLPWREAMVQVLPPAALAATAAATAASAAAPAATVQDDGAWRPYAIAEPATSPYAAPKARVVEQAAEVVRGHHIVYAGFWKRFAAWFLDTILFAVAIAVIMFALFLLILTLAPGVDTDSAMNSLAFDILSHLVLLLMSASYFGWMHASRHQASLGKMAVGIKVVRGDGERMTFWRGFWRTFAQIPSGLILMIGYIMAAFTERKQALHDMICDTRVVDKWAYTDQPQFQNEALGTVTIVIVCFAVLVALAQVAVLAAAVLALTSGLR